MRVKPGLAALVLLALSACAGGPDRAALAPSEYDSLPGWHDDDHAGAFDAFVVSCTKLNALPEDTKVGSGAFAARAEAWQLVCGVAARTERNNARPFFETQFTPYLMTAGGNPEGFFTGYYVPEIEASRTRHGPYQTPIYGRPDDLVDGVPYLTRKEIENGALAGKGLEIAWARDAAALFFVQVQGSGIVRLDSGESFRLGYAGKNHQPYVAIGKAMREEGLLVNADMFAIRGWLHSHPEQARDIMSRNPSYIFFRETKQEGARGSQGVLLTPERSLAIDPQYIPYGMPVYLMTHLPAAFGEPERSYNRLMVAQDSGSAIKGAVRADIFFGHGTQAERRAGMMKQPGRYVLLLPNAIAGRL